MTPAPGDEHSGLPSSFYQFATHRPGRVPDASTRQRPRGVQPHRLGLQHATRDQSRGTSRDDRRGSRLNPYFARFQGDNQPESGRQAIAAIPHATDTADAPADRRCRREPATVLKPRCCRISDPRLGLFTRPGPFATQADRLRPRLVAEALPTAGPVDGLVLCLPQLPNISSILPILAVTRRY